MPLVRIVTNDEWFCEVNVISVCPLINLSAGAFYWSTFGNAREALLQNPHSLQVALEDLQNFDSDLAERLRLMPADYLPLVRTHIWMPLRSGISQYCEACLLRLNMHCWLSLGHWDLVNTISELFWTGIELNQPSYFNKFCIIALQSTSLAPRSAG